MSSSTGSGLPTPSLREAAQALLEWDFVGIEKLHGGYGGIAADAATVRAALGESPPPPEIRCPHDRPLRLEGCNDCLHDALERARVAAPPQGSAPDDALQSLLDERHWLRGELCDILGITVGDDQFPWDGILERIRAGLRPQGSEPLPRIPDDTLAALLQEAIQSPELNFPNFTYANTAAWLAARGVQVRPQGEAPPSPEINFETFLACDGQTYRINNKHLYALNSVLCALCSSGLRGGEAPQ